MKQISKMKIIFEKSKSIHKNIPKINPHHSKEVKQFFKGSKFVYDEKFNANRAKLKLSLMPVYVLKNQLGVFAEEHIKVSSHSIGCYAGKYVKAGKENPDSLYIFELTDDNDKEIGFIDGEKVRDWTNFINHSDMPNLDVDQRKVKGKINIYFYVIRPIKKGEQLLFDYGKDYFHSIKHYYIHPSENWQSDLEKYLAEQQYYLPGTFAFDQVLCKTLHLKNNEWLVPEIFSSIYQNDVKTLKQTLKKSHPVDLPAYAVTRTKRGGNQMSDISKQQRMTALMFAAYLGHEKCIDILLQHRADANRCMLSAGFTPLSLLCQGKANIKQIENCGERLLRKMYNPYIIDANKRSILHYAILRQATNLIKRMLKRIESSDYELLSNHVHHQDLIYCLQQNQFTILKMIFSAMSRDESCKKPRFKQEVINKLSQQARIKLSLLLKIFD